VFESMSFYEKIKQYRKFDFEAFFSSVKDETVRRILEGDRLSELDYLALLSDTAGKHLEEMAQKAAFLTRRHFGNVIFIFTPLYISNICDNVCAYCSFARQRHIDRRHLGYEEIRSEAQRIGSKGIRHILVLTGESKKAVGIDYLRKSIEIISEHFSSVAIEVYPLTKEEYGILCAAGVDGLTIYQETYNEEAYRQYHQGGPKEDYRFRLDAPERACLADIRTVTVGALFGLYETRTEAFFTGLHAAYIHDRFPRVDVAVSLPRLRPLAGEFDSPHSLDDRQFVQFLTATRLYLPFAGITVSTRESAEFRNAILSIGVTKMSAGVSTSVGSHSGNPSTSQFEIADTRSVEQMKTDLHKMGFQAVMHDWSNQLVR